MSLPITPESAPSDVDATLPQGDAGAKTAMLEAMVGLCALLEHAGSVWHELARSLGTLSGASALASHGDLGPEQPPQDVHADTEGARTLEAVALARRTFEQLHIQLQAIAHLPRETAEETASRQGPVDRVEQASRESFPASDPPSYLPGHL